MADSEAYDHAAERAHLWREATQRPFPHALGLARYFTYAHLPPGPLRETSRRCAELAQQLYVELPDGPELTTGLRKLLEAKDCFVRAALDAREPS